MLAGNNGFHATVANTMLVLEHDEAFHELFAYDTFSHKIIIRSLPPGLAGEPSHVPGPYPREITDTDVTMAQAYIQWRYDIRITQGVAQQAVLAVAERHRVHPVREWLDTLEHDGKPRLHTWLESAFGVAPSPYHTAVGAKTLVAAVRRIRHPGAKFDHVMTLEGLQGVGKSRACAALCGQDWFTDNLPHDLTNKDSQQGLLGKWIIELAELQALVRTPHGAAKAFFSRQIDYFRPPFGKGFVERPRQCIFIGTTNETDWLGDTTGNRRYWPVKCENVNVDWIVYNRDQLWAEAADYEAEGMTTWLEGEEEMREAVKAQMERMAEDVWDKDVEDFLGERTAMYDPSFRVSEILGAMGVPKDRQNRSAEMRVSAILRRSGYKTVTRWSTDEKKSIRVWVKG